MTNKKKRPGARVNESGRSKQKSTGETESKHTRKKADKAGMGQSGAKERQARE
jgi:hypothetical protein